MSSHNSKNLRPWFAIGILGLVLCASFINYKPAHGQAVAGPSVTVVNTTANPVPAKVTNTPNVNVTNTPTVNAQQGGTWNVGINGTPNVNVANTPNVALAGTPTVNIGAMPAVTLSGTPTVNIAGGAINSTRAPVSAFVQITEPGLNPKSFQDYLFQADGSVTTHFNGTFACLDTSMLLISTANDLDNVQLGFFASSQPNNPVGNLVLQHISGGQNMSLVFNQPISFQSVAVQNTALLTSATFTMTFLGGNLRSC